MTKEMRYLAAAYVRGTADRGGMPDPALTATPLTDLTDAQIDAILRYGEKAGMKMYRFKEKEDLPRVKAALGIIKAVYPESLLDVGSGRGVFLFPFLREFPSTPVMSLDILPHRAEFLDAIHRGGVDRLTAIQADICTWDAPDNSYDAVTLLEVLEHIPEVGQAVLNAVRIARRYVVVSVPSKPDNNPEHLRLLTKDKLTALFAAAGVTKLHFDGVNGHLIMTAAL